MPGEYPRMACTKNMASDTSDRPLYPCWQASVDSNRGACVGIDRLGASHTSSVLDAHVSPRVEYGPGNCRIWFACRVVSTGDSLDHTATDLEIMRSEGAQVKEMEAAAIAWVCMHYGTLVARAHLIIKSIMYNMLTRTRTHAHILPADPRGVYITPNHYDPLFVPHATICLRCTSTIQQKMTPSIEPSNEAL